MKNISVDGSRIFTRDTTWNIIDLIEREKKILATPQNENSSASLLVASSAANANTNNMIQPPPQAGGSHVAAARNTDASRGGGLIDVVTEGMAFGVGIGHVILSCLVLCLGD